MINITPEYRYFSHKYGLLRPVLAFFCNWKLNVQSYFEELKIKTSQPFHVCDITDSVRKAVDSSGISEGIATLTSMHTTCALTVNENEERLFSDIENYFLGMAPADAPYKHNDLHLRSNIPPDEPENAHSHLISMMLGNSETVTIHKGSLVLGCYQAILLLETDGPRERKISLQILGAK